MITNKFCDRLHAEKYRAPGETHRDAMTRVAGALRDDDEHFHAFRDALLDMRVIASRLVRSLENR